MESSENGFTLMGVSRDEILLCKLRAAWRLFCDACDIPFECGKSSAEQLAIMRKMLLYATRSRVRAFLAMVDAEVRRELRVDEWAEGILDGIHFVGKPLRKKGGRR
jgi:hypothetical protein